MTKIEEYKRPENFSEDRNLSIKTIAFQGYFMQAVSGREFNPEETCILSARLIAAQLDMDERRYALSNLKSGVALGDPIYKEYLNKLSHDINRSINLLEQACKGVYLPIKDYLGFGPIDMIRKARGMISDSLTASYVSRVNDFSQTLPESGTSLFLLLNPKNPKDKNVLNQIRIG